MSVMLMMNKSKKMIGAAMGEGEQDSDHGERDREHGADEVRSEREGYGDVGGEAVVGDNTGATMEGGEPGLLFVNNNAQITYPQKGPKLITTLQAGPEKNPNRIGSFHHRSAMFNYSSICGTRINAVGEIWANCVQAC
ncbi:hypothetical protein AKJ16_DCAP17668 [Drosera capensis]